MKIYIKDIKNEGIDVNYNISHESIGLTKEDYLRFITPLKVNAHIELIKNSVIGKVKVQSRYKSYCCRTLVDVERDWSEEFLLDFPITPETEFISMDEDIRQEVILGMPMRVLCDEELKKDAAQKKEKKEEVILSGEQRTHQPFAGLRLKKE